MLSEILAHLLGCHQEFLLENSRRRRVLGCEDELKIFDALKKLLSVYIPRFSRIIGSGYISDFFIYLTL